MRSPNPICLFYGTWQVCNDLNGVCAFFYPFVFIILDICARRLLLHPYGTTAVLMFGSYNNQCIRVTAVA